MAEQTQVERKKVTRDESKQLAEDAARDQARTEHATEVLDYTDELLDAIDEVIAEEREELVRYRQAGGE